MKSLSLKMDEKIYQETERIYPRFEKIGTVISTKPLSFIIFFRKINY
jgi:hypothetical protein